MEESKYVYATVTRGYRSGGYNIQMFSDLSQTELKNSMMNAIKEKSDNRARCHLGKNIINMMTKWCLQKEIDVKSIHYLQTRIFVELRSR